MADLASVGLALGGAGALASAVGGFFGGSRSEVGNNVRTEPWARYTWLRSQTQSVRDRVADAKAAGIHPLYAMGITPQGGQNVFAQPSPVRRRNRAAEVGEGLARMGQYAVLASETEKNYAEAAYYQSLAKRTEATAGQSPALAGGARDAGARRAAVIDAEVTKRLAQRQEVLTTGVQSKRSGRYQPDGPGGVMYRTGPGPSIQRIEDEYGEPEALIQGLRRSVGMRRRKVIEVLRRALRDWGYFDDRNRRGYRGAVQKRAIRKHVRSRSARDIHRRFYRLGDY